MSDTNVETVNFLDAKIADAQEDFDKAKAKLEALQAQKQNEAAIDAIAVGATVTAKYGRGEKTREVTGTVTAIGNDQKLGKLFAVQVGDGLDATILKVRAADVKL